MFESSLSVALSFFEYCQQYYKELLYTQLKNVEGQLRQFTSLKWNSIQNIGKVHMPDHGDFGLFPKIWRPNQNLSNFDAIFVSKYDVTTTSFSHYV